MRLRLWQSASVAIMLWLGQMSLTSCSSSSDSEEVSDEVAAEGEEGNAAAPEENEATDEQASENQVADNQAAETNPAETNAAGAEPVADNTAAAGQGDLQEIIEEMNGGDATQAPPAPTNGQPLVEIDPNAGAAPPESGPSVPTPAGLPEMGSKMAYMVQKGDTLAKIATKIYGDASKWSEIQTFTNLSNPRLIYPGDVVYYQLTETTVAFAAAYESVQRSEVQVQQGDTLSTIAGRVLGSSMNWKLIWRQNDGIDNPDVLTAGTTLYYIAPGALSAAVNDLKSQIAESKRELVRVIAQEETTTPTTTSNLDNGSAPADSSDLGSVNSETQDEFMSFEVLGNMFALAV